MLKEEGEKGGEADENRKGFTIKAGPKDAPVGRVRRIGYKGLLSTGNNPYA
jgi:hypothetical protein